MSTFPTETGTFACGNVRLQSGMTLPDARIVWKSFGRLSPAKDNVIVYPTSYSAQHTDTEWLIGPQHALDPDRYFIVIPNMFGNGLSTSPSNARPQPKSWMCCRSPHSFAARPTCWKRPQRPAA